MDVSGLRVLPETPQGASTAHAEQCDQCGAPVDHNQRYCVFCGARRRHVDDPAARHLSERASRERVLPPAGQARVRRSRSAGLGAALMIAVIPVAVGIGVLVGRASNGGDAKLIAALKAQKPEIISTGSAVASSSAPTQVAALSSDFPLQRGYSVEIKTLPPAGTDQATVTSAESAARSKGATEVGLIVQRDFRVKPSPPAGAYVIYSGAFNSKSKAEQALAKLKKRFPSAIVIEVQSAGATVVGAGSVLTHTGYGTATQISGFHPTQTQLNSGKQVVNHIQQTLGKSYVNAQKGLPSQISIP